MGGNSELFLLLRKAVVSAEELASVEDVVLCYGPGGEINILTCFWV